MFGLRGEVESRSNGKPVGRKERGGRARPWAKGRRPSPTFVSWPKKSSGKAQVTNDTALQDILSPEHAQWTALSNRSWSVVLHGRRFKVEVEKGPDAEGTQRSHQRGSEGRRVMDERTQL